MAADDCGASPLADAVAESLHGMREPNGPTTRAETVTLIHSPSSATTAEAASPASIRTIPSTVAWPSPRARALAPALAASSKRSCVIPAADPARSKAKRSRTAGSATANSAVTAPWSLSGKASRRRSLRGPSQLLRRRRPSDRRRPLPHNSEPPGESASPASPQADARGRIELPAPRFEPRRGVMAGRVRCE